MANTNGNGNHASKARGAWLNVAAESAGLGVAEMVSIATSLGVVAVAEDIAPNLLKSVSKTMGKIIEPYLLGPAESFLGTFCKLEECKIDKEKSRQERAEELSKNLIVFSAAFVTSLVAKIATRKALNHLTGITTTPKRNTGNFAKDIWVNYIWPDKHDRKIFYWDEGVHMGSLILMNTGIAKQTDVMIQGSSSVLQKTLGWTKAKADRVASMAMIWEVPNVIGWLAGVGAIAHTEFKRK